MEKRISKRGTEYSILTKEEVNEINEGKFPFMSYLKGTLEWKEENDYLLIAGTGSVVLIVERDEMLDNVIDRKAPEWKLAGH